MNEWVAFGIVAVSGLTLLIHGLAEKYDEHHPPGNRSRSDERVWPALEILTQASGVHGGSNVCD